jgi:NADH-quinone oxidoreductase subunit M
LSFALDWRGGRTFVYGGLGIDGLNFSLTLATAGMFLLAIIASWKIERAAIAHFAALLLLEAAMVGGFLAVDFSLYWLFTTVSLAVVLVAVGVGGGPQRQWAASKFFLFALGSSMVLLAAMPRALGPTHALLRLAVFGLLIRMALVPVHGWLAELYGQGPAAVSLVIPLLLSGGGYGVVRFAWPLLSAPGGHLPLILAALGLLSIFYAAGCALVEKDLKRLIAYSSICQMGFVTLGLSMRTAAAVNGAIFLLTSQALSSAALLGVAAVIQERAGHREISRLGGLATTMPVFAGLSMVAFLAIFPLPGLSAFVGQVLVIWGTFQAGGRATAILACASMPLMAAFSLRAFGRVFLGRPRPEHEHWGDLRQRELAVLTFLTICMLLLGAMPWFFCFVFSNQAVVVMLKTPSP